MPSRLRSRPLAGFIEPCLPRPADRPPAGSDWLHEIKHDGFRIMALRDAAGVRLLTRKAMTSHAASRSPSRRSLLCRRARA
jgi:bifunctional non-homologous end joining protein LigD